MELHDHLLRGEIDHRDHLGARRWRRQQCALSKNEQKEKSTHRSAHPRQWFGLP
jgi:hypothetical protein